jgi:hypothetical protein
MVLGTSIVLGIIAAVANFEKRLWIPALSLAFVTFFVVMYVVGS